MGKETSISWCHHTLNAWWGCWKISPGCLNCYAAAFDNRLGGDNWDRAGPRRFFDEAHFEAPLRWNRAAEKAGERRRVFCGSMMDIAEIHPDPVVAARQAAARARTFDLVDHTPWLDWLFLSKRPENFELVMPWMVDGTDAPPNAWGGVTTEDQQRADERLPVLLSARFARYFASYEPAIGGVDFGEYLQADAGRCGEGDYNTLDWIIFGDESGRRRRPAEISWARSARDQCARAGIPFHFKQWCGELVDGVEGEREKGKIHLPVLDGSQHDEFPQAS